MSNKNKRSALETFVSKYHLGGLINSVAWHLEGKKLTTRFVSDSRALLGNVTFDGFEHDKEFEVGVYDTAKFSKMLAILDDDVKVKVTTVDDTPVSIEVSDETVKAEYILSKLDVIPQAPPKAKLPKFNVSIKVDKVFMEKFVKACSALPEVGTFTVDVKKDVATIALGFASVKSNSISFGAAVTKSEPIDKLTFPSNLMKEVLVANKDAGESTLELSSEGLAKIEFEVGNYKSTYYIVAAEEV